MNAFEFSVGIKYLDMSFKKLLVHEDGSQKTFMSISQIFFGLNYSIDYKAEEIFFL